MSVIDESLERYRAVRRRLESAVLPLATSVDGRTFTFQAPLPGLDLSTGGYVRLTEGGSVRRLGQVIRLELGDVRSAEIEVALDDGQGELRTRSDVAVRHAQGTGVVVEGDGLPFHDAFVERASADEVAALAASRRGRLEIGTLLTRPEVVARLDAVGFGRHTFLCGQSGSGKSHALGILLEQLLLETSLPLVILDPNSDFARLREPHERSAPGDRDRWAAVAPGIRVLGPGRDRPIGIRLHELDPAVVAAALRLDPIADAEEYEELREVLATARERRPGTLDEIARDGGDAAKRLVRRARNLGLDRWEILSSPGTPSLVEEIDRRDARCLVVDLGALSTRVEQTVVSATVLSALWASRHRREPVLIVADEAHNVCPAIPADALALAATEWTIAIAAEGRKFGLHLLLATQRPNKVHEQVVSQTDNLVLMRMNSEADVASIGETFSFAPTSLLRRATTFRLGEALVAGKIAPAVLLVQFGTRIAAEGGTDVSTDWLTPG